MILQSASASAFFHVSSFILNWAKEGSVWTVPSIARYLRSLVLRKTDRLDPLYFWFQVNQLYVIPSLTWGSFQQYFCPRTNWWWAVGIFSSDIEFIVCVHLKSDKFVWDYFPWDISVPPRSFICGSQCKFIAKDHIGFRLCWWCAPPHSYGTSTIGWFPFQNFWRWWRGEIHWKINFSKEVAWLIVLNNGRWMNRWTDERIKKSMNGLMNGWWRD